MANDSRGEASLYNGPDLINAAERSNVGRSIRDRYAGLVTGLGILSDAVRHRRQQSSNAEFELVIATGSIAGTSTPASVAYAGNGTNRDWCLGTAVSECNEINTIRQSSVEDTVDALRETIQDTDIVFVEDLGKDFASQLQTNFVCVPAWIKQRVRLSGEWASQIQSLKRGTRQEVSRVLRKYGYECKLSCEASDISHFYDQQYRPYIRTLYGEAAIVVDRNRFVRECRRGVLLQLIQHNEVVASALLRPIGKTMAVVWTGMVPCADAKRIPGATDALDYFSLLYAHLKGFRWLDFGPSRADLRDGALRYKNKWGSEITTGHFAQRSVFWTCNGRSAAVQAFLRRHTFVSTMHGELIALFFWNDNDDTDLLLSDLKKLLTPGISEYRVVSLTPLPKNLLRNLTNIHPRITTRVAETVAEATRLAS